MIFIKTVGNMIAFTAGVGATLLYQKYSKDVCYVIDSLKQAEKNIMK